MAQFLQGLEYATVFYFVIKAIVLFSGKVRIVKLVSVNPLMHKLGPWGPTLYIFGD